MGLDATGLAAVSLFRAEGPLGHTLTLGRQRLACRPATLKAWGVQQDLFDSEWADSIFLDHLGSKSLASIDASGYEGASLLSDLNEPIPSELSGSFDSIIDLGTTEHIFDVHQAFLNIRDMCKVDGRILHVLPTNQQSGHGLYQFSPEFFFSLYSRSNGFSSTSVYVSSLRHPLKWMALEPPHGGRRISIWSRHPTNIIVITTLVARKHLSVNQSDYVTAWHEQREISRESSNLKSTLKSVRWIHTLGLWTRRVHLQLRRLFSDPVVEAYGLSTTHVNPRAVVEERFGFNSSSSQ